MSAFGFRVLRSRRRKSPGNWMASAASSPEWWMARRPRMNQRPASTEKSALKPSNRTERTVNLPAETLPMALHATGSERRAVPETSMAGGPARVNWKRPVSTSRSGRWFADRGSSASGTGARAFACRAGRRRRATRSRRLRCSVSGRGCRRAEWRPRRHCAAGILRARSFRPRARPRRRSCPAAGDRQ